MWAIELENVTKHYFIRDIDLAILKGVTLRIGLGEFVAFMGPSGSGKSTLLHMMGALDQPTSGKIRIAGRDLNSFDDDELAALRNQEIGFVFQSFFLLPYYNALDNVGLPLVYAGTHSKRKGAAETLLKHVGLGDRLYHKPNELSGGERQRVAIARALINQPKIIFADEPTGNLDSKSGAAIMSLLKEINRSGTTVVLITHDPLIAKQAQRTLHIHDGVVS